VVAASFYNYTFLLQWLYFLLVGLFSTAAVSSKNRRLESLRGETQSADLTEAAVVATVVKKFIN